MGVSPEINVFVFVFMKTFVRDFVKSCCNVIMEDGINFFILSLRMVHTDMGKSIMSRTQEKNRKYYYLKKTQLGWFAKALNIMD